MDRADLDLVAGFAHRQRRDVLGMIWRTIPDLGPSFAKFAEGLKRHAEQRQGATQ